MPVNRAIVIQMSMLLLIIPLQYIITQWQPVSNAERSNNLSKLLTRITAWKTKISSPEKWQEWYGDCVEYLTGIVHKVYPTTALDDQEGMSPAVEVMEFKYKSGDFAASTVPRSPRSPKVKFRIGQVIRHKVFGYRGVIIGWDEKAKAPSDWKDDERGTQKHWVDMPSYSVLVHVKDREDVKMTYVVQENIEIIRNTKISHPDISFYFHKFDGTRYLARPWLIKTYPHDQ